MSLEKIQSSSKSPYLDDNSGFLKEFRDEMFRGEFVWAIGWISRSKNYLKVSYGIDCQKFRASTEWDLSKIRIIVEDESNSVFEYDDPYMLNPQ